MFGNLTEEKIREVEKEAKDKLKQYDEDNQVFIESNQDAVMEEIYDYLKENYMISNEVIKNNKKQFSFTESHFLFLYDNFNAYALRELKARQFEEDSVLTDLCYVTYKDINIVLETRWVWGKNPVSIMKIDKSFNKELSITYDDMKEWILKINSKRRYI